MIKIVQVLATLNAGGAESRMLDVFRTIDRNKFDFIFLSLSDKDNQFYEPEIKELNGRIIKLAPPSEAGVFKHTKDLIKIFKLLSKEGIDGVHAHTLYHCGLVVFAAKIAGIPIRIAHARNTSTLNANSFKYKIMIALGKFLIKLFATDRLALNDDTARYLYGKKTVSKKEHKVIHNAIDIEKFRNPKPCEDLKQIPANGLTFVHVGRFQDMKNHKFIIEFFNKFVEKHPQANLILVGDGPLRQQIENLTMEYGIIDRVHFLGHRKDIPSILSHANLFLFPSKFEGLGGVVLEAQASGIPSLVSDVVPKNVDLGIDMVKFESLNTPIAKWIEDAEDLLSKPKKNFLDISQAFIQSGFTLESELHELMSIYEKVNNNHNNI